MRALLDDPQYAALIPFVLQWYGAPSESIWHDVEGRPHIIPQGEGGEQGDALMPALFCLAMHAALEHIQRDLGPEALVVAYLDDIYIVIPEHMAARAVFSARHHLQDRCGIRMHQGKLKAYCPNAPSAVHDLQAFNTPTNEVWVHALPVEEQGVMVVGTPIGTTEFCEAQFANRLNAQRDFLQVLEDLEQA